MNTLCFGLEAKRVVAVVLVSLAAACTPRPHPGRVTEAPHCTGTQAVIVHNDTQRSVEVVLLNALGGTGPVVAVVEPGGASQPIAWSPSGPYPNVRLEPSGPGFDARDQRIRYEWLCRTSS